MFIVPIMVIIGVVNDNNLWLYLALGLSTIGASLQAAKQQAAAKAQSAAVQDAVLNLFKGVQAKNN